MSGTVLLAMLCGAGAAAAEVRSVPRTILALYDGRSQKDVRDTRIHNLLEMPLHYLGLRVQYRDVNNALPPAGGMEDVRGILTWFPTDSMERPEEFLAWAEDCIDRGKRFVVAGDLGVGRNPQGRATQLALINRFLAKLGLRSENWTPVTYDQRVVYKDPGIMDFERPLPAVLPPFDRMRPVDPRVRSHLIVRRGDDRTSDSHLVMTGPHGGWIANGYTHFASYSQDQLQWYLNPFEFLRLAFATDDLPKLDTTTLSGRRIYYAHIDGDGWRNVTEVAAHAKQKLSSAEVIRKEVIEPFSDLPFTVGPIVGDLDAEWFGTRDSLAVARRILSLPWVEAGSHTYSHPLDWETLCQAPVRAKAATSWLGRVFAWFDPAQWMALHRAIERYSRPDAAESGGAGLRHGHSRMRSYNLSPFQLDQEIAGSVAFLNRLLPAGKRVQILQWSGTTVVPESALRAAGQAGIRNMNGGDTRFDPEFHSYAWVAPPGRQVGSLRQVYSSDSNENTYTNLWKERYFGFRYLPETWLHTETPLRVKPVNLYFHMYSGEKEASLRAVIENLRSARTQELAPVAASRYAAIVDGFYSASIVALGGRRWRIDNRDGLDTVRFDRADGESVDFAKSSGVIGERRFQGSLYVALDSADRSPVVALARGRRASAPYLIQSRWRISKLRVEGAGFQFEAGGFGPGEMEWQVAPGRVYEIRVSGGSGESVESAASPEGVLRFTVACSGLQPVEVHAILLGVRR